MFKKRFKFSKEGIKYIVSKTVQKFSIYEALCLDLNGKLSSEYLKDKLLGNVLKNDCLKNIFK